MFTLITQGSFKSTGAAVNIPLPSSADYFVTFNQTQAATTQTPGRGFKFEWFGNPATANDSAYEWFKTDATNAVNMNKVTSGGFTYVTAFPQPEAPFVGTAITKANPAVASGFTGLPYNNGDRVILYNTVGMETIGGMFFDVSSVSSTGFTLLGLNATGFAGAATAVTARRISKVNAVLPEFAYVTGVTQAAQGVVTLSIDPADSFYVGQNVVFQIPSSFGMVELNTNNLPGTQDLPVEVLAINSTNYTITIDLNTTNFTPFVFPTTGSPTTPLFATVAPAGSSTQFDPIAQTFTGYNFNAQPFRSGLFIPYMHLAAGAQSPAGSANDVIIWQAFKMEATQYGLGT